MNSSLDVIIVGAGLAGLACAKRLIDDKGRIGGRILTHYDPLTRAPLELGAEFIHGVQNSTLESLEAVGSYCQDVFDTHFYFKNSSLVKKNTFWEDLEKINKSLKSTKRKKTRGDRSMEETLSRLRTAKQKKELFRGYIEGFHAADPKLLSEKGFLDAEQTAPKDLNGDSQFRPVNGYEPLLKYYSASLDAESLRLNTIVKKIIWKKNSVRLHCISAIDNTPQVFSAKKIVVSVPLGVLQTSPSSKAGISWEPYPHELERALNSLIMGDVQKIIFKFKSRFWEELTETPMGFLHMPAENYFPTWWTAMPNRLPYLAAWQGGPKAQELSQLPKHLIVERALESLWKWSGKPLSFIHDQLQDLKTHNWSQDPFSLGAYSYVKVGGFEASRSFYKPIEQTIYIAGEATVTGANRGTVAGAIESGEKSATHILGESWRPPPPSMFRNLKTSLSR